MDLLPHSGTQKHVLRESFDHEDVRRGHTDFVEAVRIEIGGESVERVDRRVGSFVDGTGEVLQKVPNSHGEMEVERVKIMELGDVVYVMALEPHGEIRGVKDGGKDVRIVDRVVGNNIRGGGSREDSETRLDRHDGKWMKE